MKLMDKFYSLLALLLVGSASLWAQDTDPFPDFKYSLYSSNITLKAQVVQNGQVVTDALVAAYCGTEIRGKGSVGAGTHPDIVFLTVYGDYQGEYQYLHFKVYTGGKIFTYNPNPSVDWEDWYLYDDQMVGTVSDPYIIDITPVSLADAADNMATLATWENETCDIALSGRTLYKGGSWNTICLPFALSEEQMAASDLAGATIMELDATGTYADGKGDHKTGFDAASGTLYLYFKTATSIEAGKPYIVKWTSGSNITNPVFPGVTVTSTPAGTVEAKNSGLNTVQFIGTYSPTPLTPNDKSNLYLGAGSTLYYPNGTNNADGQYYVNACRAYFHVDLDGSAGVRAFVFNLGDDEVTTSIEGIGHLDNLQFDNWYDLSGRKLSNGKLSNRQMNKGVYIVNGKKVIK